MNSFFGNKTANKKYKVTPLTDLTSGQCGSVISFVYDITPNHKKLLYNTIVSLCYAPRDTTPGYPDELDLLERGEFSFA
jgi:hypothetical protein